LFPHFPAISCDCSLSLPTPISLYFFHTTQPEIVLFPPISIFLFHIHDLSLLKIPLLKSVTRIRHVPALKLSPQIRENRRKKDERSIGLFLIFLCVGLEERQKTDLPSPWKTY
jgi:hypothetical protein